MEREYGRTTKHNFTGIRAETNTCESHALFRSRNGSTSQKDAMTPVPMDSATVSPTFWVKELNPFDMGLDLVRFQVLEENECER